MAFWSRWFGGAAPETSEDDPWTDDAELDDEARAEQRRELIKRVRKLEIVTRRIVNDQLAGSYHSVFKGRGMDFDEVRPYQPGDEIRFIDWNVSARMEGVYVKQFVEERELTVFILVDASASQRFGTGAQTKKQVAAELAAMLAFSAIKNNDRVGLIIFTDEIELFVPPKKGRKHVLRVISQILEFRGGQRGTNIAQAIDHFARVCKRRSVAFVLSDFQDSGYKQALAVASRRHDVVPIILNDPAELELPEMGTVDVEDPETGEVVTFDTLSQSGRQRYREMAEALRARRERMFQQLKVDAIQVDTDKSLLEPLINYFRLRAKRY